MRKNFQKAIKIWGDPVWSKIIAVAIIGLASLIYATIQNQTKGISFEDSFKMIYEFRVKLIYVIGILLFYFIGKRIFKKNNSIYSKRQRKLREFDKLKDTKTGILFKWKVYFDYDEPSISDLTGFCTKHSGAPIRIIGGRCPMSGCVNNGQQVNEYLIKNQIESILIDRWEKIK